MITAVVQGDDQQSVGVLVATYQVSRIMEETMTLLMPNLTEAPPLEFGGEDPPPDFGGGGEQTNFTDGIWGKCNAPLLTPEVLGIAPDSECAWCCLDISHDQPEHENVLGWRWVA